ncbi:MAG: hypothetical protein E6Q44_08510 [Flavobacteriales bacterium]|jgi:glucosamine--fructose-6-phosphate aminotransferase (isomerizing)|nr:MAG: hypothetical protein E6Q44_08510 [Flavobacteriales bacterium]
MCGIVAAVADRNIVPVLLEGLRKLVHCGYDSAGLAILDGGLNRLGAVGRVADAVGALACGAAAVSFVSRGPGEGDGCG